MTSKHEIYKTASIWIRLYGENAHSMALDMAEVFAGRGEPEGVTMWCRIAAAVEELQRTEWPEGASEH